MTDRRVPRPLLATLLLALLGSAPARADDAVAVWRDEALLQKRFVEALDAVEKVTGVPFETRPTLRLSTRSTIRKILRRELKPQLEATGQADQLDASVRSMTPMLLAKYEPVAHVVHLLPRRFEDESMPLLEDRSRIDEDFMRLLLAHEATHAHDWPRFDLARRLAAVEDAEALQAFDAVIEGHAQYVEKRVAALWGIEETFETGLEAILYVPEIEEPLLRMIVEAMQASLTFSYVKGHAFVEAVAAARGEAGIVALMTDPPTTTRQIEHPGEYLDPETAEPTPDLAEALGAFRFLVGDDAWQVQETPILRGMLEAVRPTVPEAHRDAFLEGYVDGRALIGRIPGETRQVVLMLLVFDSEERASTFVKHERVIQEARDEEGGIPGVARIASSAYEDGAGRDGKVEGFVARKVVDAQGTELRLASHTFVLGRIVGQIMRTNVPEIERRFEDGAIRRLGAYLEDPARSRRTDAFNIGPVRLRKEVQKLRVRVTDDRGRPVPRAKIAWRTDEETSSAIVTDGRTVLHLPPDRESVEILVYDARDADGRLRDLLPYYRKDVPLRGTFVVRLTEGAQLEGRVFGPDGRPLAGIEVRARRAEHPAAASDLTRMVPSPPPVRTDAEGVYRLAALSRTPIFPRDPGEADASDAQRYELVVEVPEGVRPVEPIAFTVDAGLPEIRLLPDDRIAVRILDPGGEPLDGCTLAFEEGMDAPPRTRGAVVSDSAGIARVARPSSPARIQVTLVPGLPDGHPGYVSPIVAIGPDTKDVTIRLQRGVTLRGRVMDRRGEPVRGVIVAAEGRGDAALLGAAVPSGRTDIDGRFEISGVARGVYRVHVLLDQELPLEFHAARTGIENEIVVTRDPARLSR